MNVRFRFGPSLTLSIETEASASSVGSCITTICDRIGATSSSTTCARRRPPRSVFDLDSHRCRVLSKRQSTHSVAWNVELSVDKEWQKRMGMDLTYHFLNGNANTNYGNGTPWQHLTTATIWLDSTTRLDGYRGVDKYTGCGEICETAAIDRYGNNVDLVYLVIGSCIHRAKASTVSVCSLYQ
jgi:hypothetical protein